MRMVHAHRRREVFLYKKFTLPWMELWKEAGELEHASSRRVIESLYHFLGEPKYCHHGNPIPDLSGEIEPIANKALFDCEAGDTFILKRVLDQREL